MRKLLLVIFFLCGATVMIHETAWSRILVLHLGLTRLSVFTIHGAFLLGLALGSLAASRWGERPSQTLWRFAGTEIGIGFYGIVFPYLAVLLGLVYPGATALVGVEIAAPLLAFAMLLFPAFLVGVKFPLMHVLVLKRAEPIARGAGAVFAVFLAGAAVGTVLGAFVLVPHVGIRGTGRMAVIMNIVLFFAALALRRWPKPKEEVPAPSQETAPTFVDEIRSSVVFATVFCTAFALSGLMVLWFRILAFFVGNHGFALPAVQASCLAGLCLGALLLSLLCYRREPHFATGGPLLFLGGGAVCLGLCVVPWLYEVMQVLRPGSENYLLASMLTSAVLLLPGAMLLSMIAPLCVGIQIRAGGSRSRESGLIYGAAGLGASLGLVAAQWFVVPSLGLKLGVMVSGFMAIAASLLMTVSSKTRPALKSSLIVSMVIAIWLIALFISGNGGLSRPLVYDSQVFKAQNRESHFMLEHYNEGPMTTASLVRDFAARAHRLFVEAEGALADDVEFPWQSLLAHLPMATCPEPEQALVLGHGTGKVAASLSHYPEWKRLEVAEPCGAALEIVTRLSSSSDQLEEEDSPRFFGGEHGRDVLKRSEGGYDLITLTPRKPCMPEAAPLYTEEFYALCRSKLDLDGVLCQWLPVYALPSGLFRQALKTFAEGMPDAACFLVGDDLILLGFARPGWRLALSRLKRIFDMPAVRADFDAAGFSTPAALAGAYVGDRAALLKGLQEDEILCDDQNRLEQGAFERWRPVPRHLAENIAFLRALDASLPERIDPDGFTAETERELGEEMRKYRRSAKRYMEGLENEARDEAGGRNFFEEAFYLNPDDRRAARRYACDLVRGSLQEIEQGRFAAAQEIITKAAAIAPDLWEVYMAEAFLNLAAGNLSGLEQMIEIMRQMQPYARLVLAFKAEVARFRGDEEEAAHNRGLLVRSGGLTDQEVRLLEAARKAREMGLARYEVQSLDLAKTLLMLGPEARTPTGRLAWGVARDLDADLLEVVKAEMLELLDEESDAFLSAVKGLGFFDDGLVRDRLMELFRKKTGPERGQILESLARAGDMETVVGVLRDPGLPSSLQVKATQIVCELKIQEAIGPLIDLLESPDASLRLGAFVALLHLTRVDFGFDPNGSEAQRTRSVKNWRYWFELQGDGE